MKNYYSISRNTNRIPSQIIKRLIIPGIFFIICVLPQLAIGYNTFQGITNSISNNSNNDNKSSSSSPVIVYQECDYGGWGIELQEGEYTLSDLTALGITDNDISSLKIQRRMNVKLYTEDNFTGQFSWFNDSINCLADIFFDNKVSSLKIRYMSEFNPYCENTNGSFSYGLENWFTWTYTGVSANFDVINEELAVTGITGATASWQAQFSYNYNFERLDNNYFFDGGLFNISFCARSTSEKTIGILIRECVSGDCGTADHYEEITIGTTMQSYYFEYNHIEPKYVYGQIVFEVAENDSDIYFDNICIRRPDDVALVIGCNGLSTNEHFINNFKISPNPASNVLEINADNIKYNMSIYSIEGKLLLEQNNLFNNNTIDISSLNNGLYILKISNGDMQMNKKIVVSK